LAGTIVLYFLIGLEILIMISPFAGFFYAVFNPVLLGLAQSPATRWLSAFFLPHMVSPPNGLLQLIRVSGSVFFVLGAGLFLVCAGQIYAAKFRKRGAVTGGLYRWIRHPQYLALGLAGAGLCILWPRFLNVLLWCLMVLVYVALARDEERRMLAAHETTYRPHMERTGMFLPRAIEARLMPRSAAGTAACFLVMVSVVLGGAFGLRAYTIRSLPLWSNEHVTALAILPDDVMKMDHRMAEFLDMPEIRSRLGNERYLAYFMPKDYIMQGLIADTGGDWKLYKRHHTFSMITDWVLHPFRHLSEGHHALPGPGHDPSRMHGDAGSNAVVRRLIVLRVEDEPDPVSMFTPLGINVKRTPLFVADVDVHQPRLLDVRDLPTETGWGRVPTPRF